MQFITRNKGKGKALNEVEEADDSDLSYMLESFSFARVDHLYWIFVLDDCILYFLDICNRRFIWFVWLFLEFRILYFVCLGKLGYFIVCFYIFLQDYIEPECVVCKLKLESTMYA